MKRSRMVIAIATYLGEICNFTYEERKIEADVLLKSLEDLGMTPPNCDYYRSSPGPNNVWEPEDET